MSFILQPWQLYVDTTDCPPLVSRQTFDSRGAESAEIGQGRIEMESDSQIPSGRVSGGIPASASIKGPFLTQSAIPMT